MLKRIVFLFFVFSLYILKVTNAQENEESKQFIYRGDTIVIQAISLYDIPDEIEHDKISIQNLSSSLEPDFQISIIDSAAKSANNRVFLEKENLFKNKGDLTGRTIRDKIIEWDQYRLRINENLSYVNDKLAKIEKNIYKIKVLIERWQLTLNNAKTQNIPEGLLTSITNFQNEINKAFVEFEAEEAILLSIQSELTQLLISVTDVKHELEREFYALQTNYLKRSEPPIWKATPSKKSISDIKEYYKNSIDKDFQRIVAFYKSLDYSAIIKRLILLILLIVLFFYLKKDSLKQSIQEKDKKYLFAKNIVTTQPLLLSLVSILSLFVLFFQNTMYSIALLLQLLLVGIYYLMLTKRFRIKYKPILINIMWLILINSFVIYFDANDIYVRFLLLISAFIAFRVFYKLNNELNKFEDIISPNWLKAIRAVIGLFGVSLMLGILGDIFGFLNISIVLIDTSINATIIALIVGVYIVITNSAILVFLQTGFAVKSNIIKIQKDIVGKYLIKISVFTWLFLWTRYVLISLGIFSYIYNWFINLIDISWKIGSVTISLEGIFGFFTVIVITYFIQRFIKNLLDNEVYPRVTLPRGVSGAITMGISYIMVFAGIYIALAIAGADFSRFTLLAGALGVGIGFGLQNIVNNFISGIILSVERPIMVGDTIEVGTTRGNVKTIGVRASTIKLIDGSEVIIPNGNLISDNVVNWTLSDRKQRNIIDVGTAYGTNPHKVLELLEKVGNNIPGVLKSPKCEATFDGFGDSSLNFQLRIWSNTEIIYRIKSQVAIAIYDAFAEEGIEIPFPQRDLHVKSIDSIMKIDNPANSTNNNQEGLSENEQIK